MNGFSSCNNQPAADWELRTCNILREVEWSLQVLTPALRSEWVSSRARLKDRASHEVLSDSSSWTAEHKYTIHREFIHWHWWVGCSATRSEYVVSGAQENAPTVRVARCCQIDQQSSPPSLLHFATWIPPLLAQQISHTDNFHQWAPLCWLASALTTARVYSITSQSIYSLWSTVQARPL